MRYQKKPTGMHVHAGRELEDQPKTRLKIVSTCLVW